jgi:hypothetical protein
MMVACLVILAVGAVGAAVEGGGAASNPWSTAGPATPVRTLGGPNAFSADPVTTVAELRAFFVRERPAIERVLTLAGWPGDPQDLFAAVASGTPEEITFPVGRTLQWMALRRGAKTVELVTHPKWEGKEPFPAFLIRLVSGDARWAFLVPKDCGNLSLYSRMGLDALHVAVTSGVLTLTDPEGRLITVNEGQTGTVSATALSGRPESALAAPDVPTSIQVTEGKVEFSEYGRPVAVMVADGNLLSAVLTPDGTVALATPSGNPTPLPVKVGDSTGTLSAGGSITVSWPAPECRLEVRKVDACVPGEVEVDARGSSIARGTVESVAVTAQLPSGESVDLGSPAVAGDFRWRRRFDQPGTYRFTATAVSNLGRPSTNPCAATVEMTACIPPPPTCRLDISPAAVATFETVRLDASGSVSDGGKVEKVLTEIRSSAGRTLATMDLLPPFNAEFELERGGTYEVSAVAVDNHGQRSETVQQTVTARVRNSFSGRVFGGFVSFRPDDAAVAEDGWAAGVKASLDRRLARGFEISLGAGVVYDEVSDEADLLADVEFNFLRGRGYFGAGVGLWGFDSDAPGSNVFLHGGHELATFGETKLGWYLEGRAFLDELDSIDDNYLALVGLRFQR